MLIRGRSAIEAVTVKTVTTVIASDALARALRTMARGSAERTAAAPTRIARPHPSPNARGPSPLTTKTATTTSAQRIRPNRDPQQRGTKGEQKKRLVVVLSSPIISI